MSLFDGNEIEVKSLTKAGVVFLVALFICIIIFLLISGPVNMMYDAFEAGSWSQAESQKSGYMAIIRTVTTIFFAILLTIPVVWFFFWVFHREPVYMDVDYKRYM